MTLINQQRRIQSALGHLGLLLILGAGALFADTATTTVAVGATVLKVCIVASTPLVFGNYTASNASPNDATATVVVTCTTGTTYEVGLNAGVGSGATVATRKMTFLTNTLNYNLYSDTSRSQNWGNTVGTDTPTATATGVLQTLTVYGRIPIGQYGTIGAYVDLVTVTVTY